MVTVCLVCGDQGIVAALDLCYNCHHSACHRYCRKLLPNNLSEDAIWFCEDDDCRAVEQQTSQSHKPTCALLETECHQVDKHHHFLAGKHFCSGTMTPSRVTVTRQNSAKTPFDDDGGATQYNKHTFLSGCVDQDQNPKKRTFILQEYQRDEPVDGSDSKDEAIGRQPKGLVGVSGFRHSNISLHRVASNPVDAAYDSKLSPRNVRPKKPTHVGHEQQKAVYALKHESNARNATQRTKKLDNKPDEDEKTDIITVKPSLDMSLFIYYDPVWRGRLSIRSRNSSTMGNTFQVVAHLSTLANNHACIVAEMLPNHLSLDMFSRSQLWPKCFQDSGPASHHVALCFFPDSTSDVFEKLVNHMIRTDLAMIAVFEQVELVVFTSHEWPTRCQRIESKYFLWGGFRTSKPSSITLSVKS